MPEQDLQCRKCGKKIVHKKDLVITSRLIMKFGIYHKECLEKAMKNGDYVGRPINTPAANIALAIILAAALVYYLFTWDHLLLLVLILSPVYRFIVWYRFERLVKQ